MDDHDAQKNKSHKGKTVGNKAAKRDTLRKKRAGIDLEPNRGKNVKAFQGVSAGSHKAQKMLRSVEKREETLHMPTVDKTFSHIATEPPLLVAVVGPPGVGKSTLIRSLVKFYSNRNVQHVRGAITVVASRSRRITFLECPTTLTAMCDVAKVADLVLLMVDGSYGFEMETFEFMSIAQVHGFPKMFGVISHLDELKTNKALKKRKKFLRHRFWHEVAAGAKLLCLSPMIRGMYRPTDVLNLHRLLICVEPRVQSWRNTHSCVLVDRYEDITDPAAVARNPNCDRTIAFYGYTRGKPMQSGQMVHIPGLGDVTLSHLSRTATDPCAVVDGPQGNSSASSAAGGSHGGATHRLGGHRMRHLGDKHKKIYAPYCDVGGVVYDEDAIYIHEDAERERIERTGPGVSLLRALQHATPMDAQRSGTRAADASDAAAAETPVVRRPVIFRDEAGMELEMEEPALREDMDKPHRAKPGKTGDRNDWSNSSSSSDEDEDEDAGATCGDDAPRSIYPTSEGSQMRSAAAVQTDARVSSPQLSLYGLSSTGSAALGELQERQEADKDAASNAAASGLVPRRRDAEDSVRIHRTTYPWHHAANEDAETGRRGSGESAIGQSRENGESAAAIHSDTSSMPALVMLRRLKNLCVTGNWDAGKRRAGRSGMDDTRATGRDDDDDDDDDAEEGTEDKGYVSTDEEFDAVVRAEQPMPRIPGDSASEEMHSTAAVPKRDALAGVRHGKGDTNDEEDEDDYDILDDDEEEEDDHASRDEDAGTNRRMRRGGQSTSARKSGAASLRGADSRSSRHNIYDRNYNNDEDDELQNLVSSFLVDDAHERDSRGVSSWAGDAAKRDGMRSFGGHVTTGAMDERDEAIQFYDPRAHAEGRDRNSSNTVQASDSAMQSEAVMRGERLTAEQERQMQLRMAKKRAFDDNYDAGATSSSANATSSASSAAGMKNMTYAHYNALQRKAEAKKEQLDAALREVGEELDTKIQLVGYFSGLYIRAVVSHIPVEFVRLFSPATPLLLGGVNAGEGEYRVVHARLKRHRWYPKILKAQDPLLISMGWRRFQTQPIFASEEANGRMRYLKYTPLHMHCVAAFYAPVAPPNTGFLALPVSSARVAQFRLSCTGYTLGNDVTASVVKKLKITGTPAKVEKTTVFIKGMFSSDVEAAKFVGAKVKSVSGVRGIIKAALKGKQGMVRATFEDKLFASDIVFIRAWTPVEPPRYCSIQRNLVDTDWVGMRSMRELRLSYGVAVQPRPDSEYTEIKRRQRGEEGAAEPSATSQAPAEPRVLLSRNTRMQLPYDMKEEFIAFAGRSSELAARMTAATTVAPEPREQRRQALLDTFADRADAMRQKKEDAKQRARVRAQREADKENAEYVRGLKRAKKETARRSEFRSQHKSRSK